MYIAIDIGGTNTRIGKMDGLDDAAFADIVRFPTSKEYEKGVANIVDAITFYERDVDAIAIGFAGRVDATGRHILNSDALVDWVDQDIHRTLSNTFDCSVYMTNDAVMGALGEAYYDAHSGHDFVYLTWGTGVGGAICTWRDAIADVQRHDDRTFLHEMEKRYGGSFLAKHFGILLGELPDDQWDTIMKNFFADAQKITTLWGKQQTLVGGGLTAKQHDRLKNYLAQNNLSTITLSELGDDCGLYGSIAYIRQKQMQ